MTREQLKQLKHWAKEVGIGEVSHILATATVLHKGWKMDNTIWYVQMMCGKRLVLTTNNGCCLCVCSKEELQTYINKTVESLDSLHKIARMLP